METGKGDSKIIISPPGGSSEHDWKALQLLLGAGTKIVDIPLKLLKKLTGQGSGSDNNEEGTTS